MSGVGRSLHCEPLVNHHEKCAGPMIYKGMNRPAGLTDQEWAQEKADHQAAGEYINALFGTLAKGKCPVCLQVKPLHYVGQNGTVDLVGATTGVHQEHCPGASLRTSLPAKTAHA